jgi:hypothetical protein
MKSEQWSLNSMQLYEGEALGVVEGGTLGEELGL